MGMRDAFCEDIPKSYRLDTADMVGDFDRLRGLRSMRGVRSEADDGSMACDAVVAVVKIEGADVGASNGERGGVTSGSCIRRFKEYSPICVWSDSAASVFLMCTQRRKWATHEYQANDYNHA